MTLTRDERDDAFEADNDEGMQEYDYPLIKDDPPFPDGAVDIMRCIEEMTRDLADLRTHIGPGTIRHLTDVALALFSAIGDATIDNPQEILP